MTDPGLYVVSTPIGNLKDITLRALEILKEVNIIACEDTRRTTILLRHYAITNKLFSYHEFNKVKQTPYLIEQLRDNRAVAVVSDAGTPGISDPGFYLVREALRNGVKVIPIPGPSAFLSALVVSGLPTDRFVFEGYLPKKPGKRSRRLSELKDERRTIILYESPMRIRKLLNEMASAYGDRDIVLARELTKKFETISRGKISELMEGLPEDKVRGEFVVLIRGQNG